MNLKTKLAVLVLAVGAGYGIGRYLQPADIKIKTETKIVEVEVEKEKILTKTIVRYIKRPDGTEETVTETEQVSEKESTSTKNKEKIKDKQIASTKPQWRAQVSTGVVNLKPTDYRVGVERRILGPVFVGGWTETNLNSFGVSVSMEF